jgi:hypothetical protein
MKINEIRNAYIAEGLSYLDAGSRTCQDIILALIAKSPLSDRITIKGGVLMQHISGDSRRATQDFDMDFIRYSLNDESVISFVEKLNMLSDAVSIRITTPIEELKHQDYHGKRVYIRIMDSEGTSLDTKLDIGVHKDITIEQDVYCFDLCKLDDSVTLLVNTKEQIFTEKLKSLLRLGAFTTRFKDIFDMYWLAVHGELSKSFLLANISIVIFGDPSMRENGILDVASRLENVFSNTRFVESLKKSKRYNWLDTDAAKAAQALINYFNTF